MNTLPGGPLGLETADREIRIERLRQEIKKVTGGEFASGQLGESPSWKEASFLENVLEIETQGFIRPFDDLAAAAAKKNETNGCRLGPMTNYRLVKSHPVTVIASYHSLTMDDNSIAASLHLLRSHGRVLGSGCSASIS